ncbi:MAG: DNA replication complex GINS family protein [Desulfurococcales archaeon]|nr:DNA replication complex GINS family protein [Desulfurococcales archaeon]
MDLRKRIELIKLDYELTGVRVVFLRSFRKLPTPGGVINARKGDELELPRWQARLLEAEGIVDVREQDMDIDYVNTYHFREKKRVAANQLSQMPRDFYLKAKELVDRLNKLIRESPSHMLLRDREIVEKNLIELAESRLVKIMRLAQTGGGEELRDRMTPEEVLVYDSLKNIVESWRSYIRSIFPEQGEGS